MNTTSIPVTQRTRMEFERLFNFFVLVAIYYISCAFTISNAIRRGKITKVTKHCAAKTIWEVLLPNEMAAYYDKLLQINNLNLIKMKGGMCQNAVGSLLNFWQCSRRSVKLLMFTTVSSFIGYMSVRTEICMEEYRLVWWIWLSSGRQSLCASLFWRSDDTRRHCRKEDNVMI